jgi:hypothetical protein
LLWLTIVGGVAVRVALAFATIGQEYDIENLRVAGAVFIEDPLAVYERLNTGGTAGSFVLYGWPYPPGLLPYMAVAGKSASALGLPFHGVVQLLPIAADAAIAWLVQDFLGRRGASEVKRLAAAALVAFGPSFAVISGYHGQIDAVAILPAVAAVWLWESSAPGRRALPAGLLIGLGASIKTVPGLVVLALLPSARGRREAVTLVVAAVAVPLVVLAPYVVSDAGQVQDALGYGGAPGLGGISMFVQPALAESFLTNDFSNSLSGPTRTLYDNASLLVLAGLAGCGLFLLRFRPRPVDAAVLVWLTVYVFNPNFFPQYLVWGLPFFLMAGYLREVAILQAALVPVIVFFYAKPWGDWATLPYFAIMAALWIAWVSALFVLARRHASFRRPSAARA